MIGRNSSTIGNQSKGFLPEIIFVRYLLVLRDTNITHCLMGWCYEVVSLGDNYYEMGSGRYGTHSLNAVTKFLQKRRLYLVWFVDSGYSVNCGGEGMVAGMASS